MRVFMRRSSIRYFLFLLAASAAIQAQNVSGGMAGAARQNNAARQVDQGVVHIDDRATYTVTQVDQDVVYVNAGSNRGLAEGMTLIIRRSGRYTTTTGDEVAANIIVAILEVTAASSTTAMCQV